LGKYEKVNRATLTINENFYLLVALDIEEKNFDLIIMEKVLPLVNKDREKFKVDEQKGAADNKSAAA
jgi:hypothetical protein